MLFSLLHAADMILRYDQEILPALHRNKIVLCDRYIYTSLVRDSLRGVDTSIVEKIYAGLRHPDIIFHFVVPTEVAVERALAEKDLNYYSAGMDLNLSSNREESCFQYEGLMDKRYREVLNGVRNCVRVSTDRSIKEVWKDIKGKVANLLEVDG